MGGKIIYKIYGERKIINTLLHLHEALWNKTCQTCQTCQIRGGKPGIWQVFIDIWQVFSIKNKNLPDCNYLFLSNLTSDLAGLAGLAGFFM